MPCEETVTVRITMRDVAEFVARGAEVATAETTRLLAEEVLKLGTEVAAQAKQIEAMRKRLIHYEGNDAPLPPLPDDQAEAIKRYLGISALTDFVLVPRAVVDELCAYLSEQLTTSGGFPMETHRAEADGVDHLLAALRDACGEG